MRSTFKTVFYVNGSKERNGIVPIMGRVTINGTIAQFSCKLSVTKAIWDAKGNRAKGRSKEANEVNFALDNIKAQIAKHYQRLSDREAFVTAEMVRNAYQGIGTEYETLLRAFDKENAAFAQRVGKDRAVRTYRKYLTVRKYVAEFIKFQYKRSDMSMNELTEEFIRDFCLYLKNVIGLTQSTIWIYSIPLKHIVTAAHYNGKIQRNPFAMYHVDPDHKEREFLTEEELDIFAGIELENPNFAFARDLFMFGCWTGISFVDIKNLTEDNVAIISGSPWIVSQRQKTGVPFKIKLIDAAIQIIERYKPLRKDMHLFNIGSLDMVNKRIKKVAKMCGIKKRISFHVSRHSFAVLALNYGMPIESVSKILGHTDIATTQIYAKVTSTKLEHDISAFESRIKGHMPTMGGNGMKMTVITVDGNGMLSIPSNLQDLWMSEGELVDMLHVTAMKLHAVIRSIYKDGLLTVSEVQQKQETSNGIWQTLYGFPMIVALCFRINSYGAARFRATIFKRLYGAKEKSSVIILQLNRRTTAFS